MKKFKVTLICGSARPRSKTRAAMQLLVDELTKTHIICDVIDPLLLVLPPVGSLFEEPHASELRARVASADGVIFCTPEYNGSFSSVLMAIIENLGYPAAFSGKPVALLGVAGGRIGAVKALEHLRSVCAHCGALVLPGSISIAEVYRYFDDEGRSLDVVTENRVRAVAQTMVRYLREGAF